MLLAWYVKQFPIACVHLSDATRDMLFNRILHEFAEQVATFLRTR